MNVTEGKPLPTSQFLARGCFEAFSIDNDRDSFNGMLGGAVASSLVRVVRVRALTGDIVLCSCIGQDT